MIESYTSTPRLLYVATQLFIKQGFAATSVDQICRTTGVSKGAFFHYFRSKDEIAEVAIDNYWELLSEYLFGGLEFHDGAGRLERVRERFHDMPDHIHFANGSLLSVLALEVAPQQAGIRSKLSATYITWEERLAEILIGAGINPRHAHDLARQWMAVYEGSCAQAKIADNKQVIRDQLSLFEKLLLLP